MNEPYIYTDPDRACLTVSSYPSAKHGLLASVRAGETVYITRRALPEVIRALYEACGLPAHARIVLERPEIHGDCTQMDGFTVTAKADLVGVIATHTAITPALARTLAAVIAARADQAEALAGDFSHADVTALAELLREGPGFDTATSHEIARWLLRQGVHLRERDER